MKAFYQGNLNITNFTFGKGYEAKPSFVEGFASIIDDNGVEQLIRIGEDSFVWEIKPGLILKPTINHQKKDKIIYFK